MWRQFELEHQPEQGMLITPPDVIRTTTWLKDSPLLKVGNDVTLKHDSRRWTIVKRYETVLAHLPDWGTWRVGGLQ